jgi:hypothetical protein
MVVWAYSTRWFKGLLVNYFWLFKKLVGLQFWLQRVFDALIAFAIGSYFSRAYKNKIEFFNFRWMPADQAKRWSIQAPVERRLTIVVVTYKQAKALQCLLDSLVCQTVQNFDVLVIHDGADAASRAVAASFVAAEPQKYRYIETDVRYNDYGHTLRDMGIQQAAAEFVLVTNGDNYYSPRFLEFAFEAINTKQLDLVMWDIVHSHGNPGDIRQPSCCGFSIYPFRQYLDIGAFMVRSAIAKEVGFRGTDFAADALYMEHIISRPDAPLRMGRVQKILMVHN